METVEGLGLQAGGQGGAPRAEDASHPLGVARTAGLHEPVGAGGVGRGGHATPAEEKEVAEGRGGRAENDLVQVDPKIPLALDALDGRFGPLEGSECRVRAGRHARELLEDGFVAGDRVQAVGYGILKGLATCELRT